MATTGDPVGSGGAASDDTGSRGRFAVDLLAALDQEMHEVASVFPSAGPPPCPSTPPVAELVQRWQRQRVVFDDAAADLERLDHTARVLSGEERRALTARLAAVRDARAMLEDIRCELRRVLAAELDRGVPGPEDRP